MIRLNSFVVLECGTQMNVTLKLCFKYKKTKEIARKMEPCVRKMTGISYFEFWVDLH